MVNPQLSVSYYETNRTKGLAVPRPYLIIQVQPEWKRVKGEDMGSKRKFWYGSSEMAPYWLFKFPQDNTELHWAEKIAAEIAANLGVLHAKVELAEFQGIRGSITESFVSEGQELVHGNQLLERIVQGYDPEKKFGQSAHTLSNILKVLDHFFGEREGARKIAKLRIAEYLVLDALIGNTDRHHENWGILQVRTEERWEHSIAPSFDHGSSLGRELQDDRRDRLLAEGRVGWYVEKAPGAIYWSGEESHGLNALELVRRGTCKYPDIFRPALVNLAKLDDSAIRVLVNRVPGDWITPSARRFAISVLCYRFERLGELI